jgi:hypothetical protein
MLVRLTVYDILGRQVDIPVNEVQSSGNIEMRWDASGMSSGVYVYRLEAGGQSTVRNMMLVR